jgi:hypothetical protein
MGRLAVSAKYSHVPLTDWPCDTKGPKGSKALGDVLVALTKEELGNDEFAECLRKSVKKGFTLETTLYVHTAVLRRHYWDMWERGQQPGLA